MNTKNKNIADVIEAVFISPNEIDRNLEAANVVDGLFAIARALDNVSKALYRLGTADAETPMGAIEVLSQSINEGLHQIAGSIDELSDEVSEINSSRPTG